MAINGFLKIKVEIRCPGCGECFNLIDDERLKDDGWIYNLVMPNDEAWSGACKDFSKEYKDSCGEDYTCPGCEKVIYIREILY